jgi:hypothetical protein
LIQDLLLVMREHLHAAVFRYVGFVELVSVDPMTEYLRLKACVASGLLASLHAPLLAQLTTCCCSSRFVVSHDPSTHPCEAPLDHSQSVIMIDNA